MGFSLPTQLLGPRCALTAPFHPYQMFPPGGIFSVALSVAYALSANPRPLAGMLPWGDRTFLSTSGNPDAQRLPDRAGKSQYRIRTPPGRFVAIFKAYFQIYLTLLTEPFESQKHPSIRS